MLKANESRPQLALITWVESRLGLEEWEHLDGMEPLLPMRMVSIGWIVDESRTYITIASDLSDTQVWGRRTIPKSTIVEPLVKFDAPWPK